jgi:twin arginine-targeting protein translocase TatB
MFEIGFSELVLLLVVALLVLGPERLPRFVRTLGFWLGKARRLMQSIKAEVERELAAEELRQTLAKQTKLSEIQHLVDDLTADVQASGPNATAHGAGHRDIERAGEKKSIAQGATRDRPELANTTTQDERR